MCAPQKIEHEAIENKQLEVGTNNCKRVDKEIKVGESQVLDRQIN